MKLRKSHFFWRTFLGYFSLVLLSTFVLALLLVNTARRNETLAIDGNLRTQTELLALSVINPALDANYDAIRDVVAHFAEASGSRFTVMDAEGVVLADSHELPQRMQNHLSRPEIQESLIKGSGQALRYSETLAQNFTYYALPLYSDGQLTGLVRTAYSFADTASRIKQQQDQIIFYAFGIMLTGLFLSYYLAARQARIVENITDVADVISQGDFERRVSVSNEMGLGKLGQAINQLARNSAERVALITADRNRLAAIFTGMVEGVIDVDQDQRIIHINETAAKMLGLSQLNCVGKLVWEEIRDNEIINAIDQVIKTRSVLSSQTSLSVHKGIMEIYAASLSDDSGEPIGAIVVLHDVTDLKNLERVRTDFVANASHELKTPITAIRGLSETILEDEDADHATALRFMDRIHAQSVRLSQLVADLITISRLESTQGESELARINMNELLKRGVKNAEAAIEERKQKLSLTLPEDTLNVFGDNQNLVQLLDNLIDNAIKYTPEGGEIKVSLQPEGTEMLLEVADSGIGISSQDRQRVFERFYRVDKARSQSLGGTGLGLSIVKNIADKHGGSVSVRSQLGNGSTFSFRMLLAEK